MVTVIIIVAVLMVVMASANDDRDGDRVSLNGSTRRENPADPDAG